MRHSGYRCVGGHWLTGVDNTIPAVSKHEILTFVTLIKSKVHCTVERDMSEKRALTIYVDMGRDGKTTSVLILNGIERLFARRGETLYHLRGLTTDVVVISTLPNCDRAAAVRLAASVVGGTVATIRVDLREYGYSHHTRRRAQSR